jgi:hypothetical protein
LDILDSIRFKIQESRLGQGEVVDSILSDQEGDGTFSGMKTINDSMRKALEDKKISKKAMQMAFDEKGGNYDIFDQSGLDANAFQLSENDYVYTHNT